MNDSGHLTLLGLLTNSHKRKEPWMKPGLLALPRYTITIHVTKTFPIKSSFQKNIWTGCSKQWRRVEIKIDIFSLATKLPTKEFILRVYEQVLSNDHFFLIID